MDVLVAEEIALPVLGVVVPPTYATTTSERFHRLQLGGPHACINTVGRDGPVRWHHGVSAGVSPAGDLVVLAVPARIQEVRAGLGVHRVVAVSVVPEDVAGV